jgi:hypothetical protein
MLLPHQRKTPPKDSSLKSFYSFSCGADEMIFRLPLDSGAEQEVGDHHAHIPVIYRLEIVSTAKLDGEAYAYELDGHLADRRSDGVIKDTFHRSPSDPYDTASDSKIDAILLYEPQGKQE